MKESVEVHQEQRPAQEVKRIEWSQGEINKDEDREVEMNIGGNELQIRFSVLQDFLSPCLSLVVSRRHHLPAFLPVLVAHHLG